MKTKCQLNNFGFPCNDNVSKNYLWKDGIHFTDKGTNILVGKFVNVFNYFVLNRNYNINNNLICLRLTDSQLYSNQISGTLSEGSVGVSNKEFIMGEGIKYKEPIKLDKKDNNGYEHKSSDMSSCIVSVLDEIRTKNINRLIIYNLNINSLSSKFEQLKVLIQRKIDILVITETKFVIIHIKGDMPSKKLRFFNMAENLESIFVEINRY